MNALAWPSLQFVAEIHQMLTETTATADCGTPSAAKDADTGYSKCEWID